MNMYKYNIYTYIYVMYVYMYNSITDTYYQKQILQRLFFYRHRDFVEKDQIQNII